MCDIRRPSNSGSGDPDTGTFIQSVNGREHQIHELCYWDIKVIWHKFHPEARVDIPVVTVGEFATEHLSENKRHNQITGEFLINGSVQFIGLSDIWGCRIPYIPNLLNHIEDTGW